MQICTFPTKERDGFAIVVAKRGEEERRAYLYTSRSSALEFRREGVSAESVQTKTRVSL